MHLALEECLLPDVLAHRAAADGARPFIRQDERVWTFADVRARALSFARGLRAAGIGKGDRVALYLPNRIEYVFAWFGCAQVGAAIVPVNTMYTAALLEYVLRDSGAAGLVADASLLAAVEQLPPESVTALRCRVLVGGGSAAGRWGTHLDDFVVPEGDVPSADVDFRDLHAIMYTSGTTGPSKGVLASNAHFVGGARAFLDIVALRGDDIIFTPMPLFHGVASRMGVLPALLAGCQIVIAERFSVSRFWQQVTECGATVGHTIFTIPPMLKAQPAGAWDRAHKLRAMYNANTDPEFEARFNVRLVEGYGLTETGPCVYVPWPETRPLGSSGRIRDDWQLAIHDEFDRALPPGTRGEIVVRPNQPCAMMSGYVNKPEATVEVTRNFWFHTGDIGHVDDKGHVYFTSRIKDRIRRRGENVSPFEVEAIVSGHPAVREAAALAHPSPFGEDDIRLVVARQPDASLEARQLMDWLVGRMPYFMMPRYIEFIDRLPRNALEKVEKYRLVDSGLSPDAWDREAHGYELQRGVVAPKAA